MWKRMSNIWRKELIDSLRDRKALRMSLMMPVLMGIAFAIMSAVFSGIGSRSEDGFELQTVATIGHQYISADLAAIFDQLVIEIDPYTGTIDELEAAVKAGDIELGLVMPEQFEADILADRPTTPIMINNVGTSMSDMQNFNSRLSWAFDQYNDQLVAQRLSDRGIDPAMLTPITVETRNTAFESEDDIASSMGSMMTSFYFPMILAIAIGAGGLMTAIDVTAGEKERGTLESLLLTPAADSEIFMGKALAVVTMTLIPTTLTVLAYVITSDYIAPMIWEDFVSMSITFDKVLLTLLLCLPFIFIVGLMQMLLALRTKTAKDAQTVMGFANLVVMFPMMGGAFMRPDSPLLHLIPGFGTASIIGKMISGDSYASLIPVSLISLIVVGAIAVLIGRRMFNRERLLY